MSEPRAPAAAPQPKASPLTAVPRAAQPAPSPLPANWQDWPLTPGDWVYRRDDRGSVALFGRSGADADFLIRCVSATKRIYLSRSGAFSAGITGLMTVRAFTTSKGYGVSNNGDTPPYVSAFLTPDDPLLDAVAFSRGRFTVSVKGAGDLVIPAWPEFARVVEDCRG
ncbi:MAG: hypothetical protein ACKVOJ_00765 [Sphingomonadaceae bacterium]